RQVLGHPHFSARNTKRSVRAVKADNMRTLAASGDEGNSLAGADAPFIHQHRDRSVELWFKRFDPKSVCRLTLEAHCRIVVERRVLVELGGINEETHHPRHELVRTARIRTHINHDALRT